MDNEQRNESQQSAPDIDSSTSTNPIVVATPKKSNKKIVVVIAIVAVIGAAVGAYFVLNKKSENKPSQNNTGNSNQQEQQKSSLKDADFKTIMTAVKDLADKNNLELDTNNTNSNHYAALDISTATTSGFGFLPAQTGASYKYAKDFTFTNSESKESDTTYCDLVHSDLNKVRQGLETIFSEAGFKNIDKADLFHSYQYEDCSDAFVGMRGGDYCSIVINLGSTAVDCGDGSKLDEAIKETQIIADSLNTFHKTTNPKRNIVFAYEISQSQTSGYEIIKDYQLEVGSLAMYRKTGTTTWTIFDITEPAKDGSTCSLYSTEAKIAFKGETCKDIKGLDVTM